MPRVPLSWVLVDGEPRRVSQFAALRARQRPAAICPQCGRRLTLKLGNVRQHHAAHEPRWRCPALRAETALHLDCKLALAYALRSGAGQDVRLRIRQRCAGDGAIACGETETRDWCRGWTDVRVDYAVADGSRPDILLLANGVPAGAIEVLGTHAVSAEKAAKYAHMPWIEVRADDRLARPGAWETGQPLDVVRCDAPEPWRCARHAAEHAARVRSSAQAREEERERSRVSTRTRAARVVDLYHPGGRCERLIYRILEVCRDGHRESLRVCRGTFIIAEVPAASDAKAAVRTDVADLCDRPNAGGDSDVFADSPMRWATGDAAEFIIEEAPRNRVPGESSERSTMCAPSTVSSRSSTKRASKPFGSRIRAIGDRSSSVWCGRRRDGISVDSAPC